MSAARLKICTVAPLVLVLLLMEILLAACAGNKKSARVVIAATATANEPAPAMAENVRSILKQVAETSDDAKAVVVGQTAGSLQEVELTPRRSSRSVERAVPRKYRLIDENIQKVQNVLYSLRGEDGLDISETLSLAARAANTPDKIIIVSSGLGTTGAIDYRQLGLQAKPEYLVHELRTRGALPDFKNEKVMFSGLADTAGRQQELPTTYRRQLIADMKEICRAGDAVQCDIDRELRHFMPPRTTQPSPTVPIPAIKSVPAPSGSPPGSIQQVIPADLLFAFDKATLEPDASAVLEPLVTKAVSGNYRVRVVGYADPVGSDEYNQKLSEDRAQAVAKRLVNNGLPEERFFEIRGVGTSADPPTAGYSNGKIDEAKCANLRRVVIELVP